MRRDRSHLFPLISILLLFPALSYGQAWSGILAPSRAINWGNAGLPATLPDGETTPNPWTPPTRTQCGSTIASGASLATINAALAACTAGHYVLLGPGTFNISGANNCFGGSATCIQLYAQNGVTLRGSGAQSTILNLSGNATIAFSVSWNKGTGIWSGGFSQGATSVTMSSFSGSALVPGELVFLQQCDTGFSGSPCAGSSVDNGGLYICGDNSVCQINAGQTGPQHHQQQTVYVTSVAGGGPYTVNFTPGIYMPNWSSSNSPTINWTTSSSAGNTVTPYGNGLEDLTVDMTGGDTYGDGVDFKLTYASWVKGVRFLGTGSSMPLSILATKNCLVMNNYFFSDVALDSGYPPGLQQGSSSDDLVLNNIMASGVPWEGTGSSEGNVVAYNYGRDTFTMYYENNFFEHNAGSAFLLYEGNQSGEFTDDATHGTHTLNTWFRNYMSGWDAPYQTINPRGVTWDAYARFENAIGNSIGSSLLTNYESKLSNVVPNYVYQFSGGGHSDPLTETSSMRWGNCDTVTGTCRFQSTEVPTTLTGAANPFQNPVPSNQNLPCSFFLAGYSSTTCSSHPNGGTGLSWWKVCASWTTFPTSCATSRSQPFPPVGSDVTGGPYVNGTAYDIPAAIAFQSLPIDTSYQNSYSITLSTWASGTETLTVSGLPTSNTHIMGGFQITGVSACNSPAGSEFVMTSSTATTISYALASNPGSCAGGIVKFPDIRQFDERVYQNDSAGSGPASPTGLSVVIQ